METPFSILTTISDPSEGTQSTNLNYTWQTTDVVIELVKTHPDAKLPTKAHDDDNCFDLYAVEDTVIPASRYNEGTVVIGNAVVPVPGTVDIGNAVVPVGLTLASITPGYGFVIKGRSGLGFKHGLMPHFGEIDNGYRNDLGVKLYNLTSIPYTFKKGDRVAQFKVEKVYNTTIKFVDSVTQSERGATGFGASGK